MAVVLANGLTPDTFIPPHSPTETPIMTTTRQNSTTRFAHRALSLGALTLLAITATPETAEAQTFNLGGLSNNRGFHQPSARRNMARYGNHLWAAVVEQDGKVIIRRKVEDVTTPWSTIVTPVNTNTTGIGATRPTTTVAMAVGRLGYLHITWGRYYYPSYFKQYYRCYKIGSGFTHAPQDITALVGASVSTRTDSMAIAVDAKDHVFLTAPNGTQSWRSRLLQSNWTSFPTGVAPSWLNRGSIAGNSASSSNVRMVVDSDSRVQLAFYNNTGNGQYATRVFTQPSTWSPQEQIGVPPSPRDSDGYLASDFSRFTHVLYKHLVSKVGTLSTYQLRYRRRLGTMPWSAPLLVDTFTSADHGANNPTNSYALAATAKGDRVFAIYRDYKCNRLMVKQKKIMSGGFEFLAELQPPSPVANDYYMPSVRNTLFPTFNGLTNFLDISYRRPGGSTFRFIHQRLHVLRMDVDKTGCGGTCGVPAMVYGGVPCSPNPHTVSFGVEKAKPGAMAFLLYTLSDSTVIPFAGCTLYATSVLSVQTVTPCCTAKVNFGLPGGCYGLWIYNQWAIVDSGASGGWAMSNRGKILL